MLLACPFLAFVPSISTRTPSSCTLTFLHHNITGFCGVWWRTYTFQIIQRWGECSVQLEASVINCKHVLLQHHLWHTSILSCYAGCEIRAQKAALQTKAPLPSSASNPATFTVRQSFSWEDELITNVWCLGLNKMPINTDWHSITRIRRWHWSDISSSIDHSFQVQYKRA